MVILYYKLPKDKYITFRAMFRDENNNTIPGPFPIEDFINLEIPVPSSYFPLKYPLIRVGDPIRWGFMSSLLGYNIACRHAGLWNEQWEMNMEDVHSRIGNVGKWRPAKVISLISMFDLYKIRNGVVKFSNHSKLSMKSSIWKLEYG